MRRWIFIFISLWEYTSGSKIGRYRTFEIIVNVYGLSGSPLAIRLYAEPYHQEEIETPSGKCFTLINTPYSLTGMLSSYIESFFSS